MAAKLFVGNISSEADVRCLRRLFAAYGNVTECEILAPPSSSGRYALVTYTSVDDADSAIAALHLRYRMAPQESLIVLYHKDSKRVTDYGRKVGYEYRRAMEQGLPPNPIPLVQFDINFHRSVVNVPQLEFPRPPQGFLPPQSSLPLSYTVADDLPGA